MFSFFRKTPPPNFPFKELGTDTHSHILPGIDDGAPDAATSLQLIEGLLELGFHSFTATPHVMEDMFRNNTDTIMRAHEKLTCAMKDVQMHVPVTVAAEYLMDGNFEQLLTSKEPLLTIQDNWVLFEISFVQPPRNLKQLIFEMQLQGYHPVIAHPERYGYYHSKKSALEELHALGCYFQSNLLSFSGYYGPAAQQAAEYLAEKGFTSILGTDLHHQRHLEALRELKLTNGLKKVLEKGN
jgi:tyrosine-protein phosphatase YwqE